MLETLIRFYIFFSRFYLNQLNLNVDMKYRKRMWFQLEYDVFLTLIFSVFTSFHILCHTHVFFHRRYRCTLPRWSGTGENFVILLYQIVKTCNLNVCRWNLRRRPKHSCNQWKEEAKYIQFTWRYCNVFSFFFFSSQLIYIGNTLRSARTIYSFLVVHIFHHRCRIRSERYRDKHT